MPCMADLQLKESRSVGEKSVQYYQQQKCIKSVDQLEMEWESRIHRRTTAEELMKQKGKIFESQEETL